MKTKREESILDIMTSFEEMADIILGQLKLLEKFMKGGNEKEHETLISEIREKENEIDRYEVLISEKFINSVVLYQPVASDIRKIVAVYRMTINLERIGDTIINIIDSIENIKCSAEYQAMLEDFLNALGIKNEKGVVDNLPENMDDAKLKPAIEALLAKYPPEVVAVYLNAFNDMNEANWTNLKSILESDSRLQLGSNV